MFCVFAAGTAHTKTGNAQKKFFLRVGDGMYKRVVAVFSAFALVFGLLSMRVLQIQNSGWAAAAVSNSSVTVYYESTRGLLYDCKMRPITYMDTQPLAAVKPTQEALEQLSGVLGQEELARLYEQLSDGKPTVLVLEQPVESTEDVTVVERALRYGANGLACHIIGYTGGDSGEGESGLEKTYNDYLKQFKGELRISYPVDANGRLLAGAGASVTDTSREVRGGIRLTLDRDIQQIAERAMDENGIDQGAVVIMEAGSGKIRALASRPAYDANRIADYLNDPSAPLINRALHSYAVGSVFKPVVAAAALAAGVDPNFTYECTGSIQVGDTVFHCHKEEGHGLIGMDMAVAESCNTYFVALGQAAGAQAVLSMAENLGFGSRNEIASGMVGDAGTLPSAQELKNPAALANFSFGQGRLSATPLQVAAMYNTFASGGQYYEPYLYEAKIDAGGEELEPQAQTAPLNAIDRRAVLRIDSYLEKTVREGSGAAAASALFASSGKTATAQTGQYVGGVEKNQSWFAGFFPSEAPQYTIVILKEDGISGGIDCAPVFKAITEGIHALGGN